MGEIRTFTCIVILKSNSETALNPLIFDEVTDKNKLAPFMAHGVERDLTPFWATVGVLATVT